MEKFRLKNEFIAYEDNENYVVFNLIEEKFYILNDTAKIIFSMINSDEKEIIKNIKDNFGEIPTDIMEIVLNFKKELVRKFFIYE